MWSHQRHLVITSPEQSPDRIQLSLQNQKTLNSWHKGMLNIRLTLPPRPTFMGVYHLLCCGRRRGGFRGLGSYGSNSWSGILTTAFLGLSSLAPSSVEPFSPQRTWKSHHEGDKGAVENLYANVCVCMHLHAFDAPHSPATIVGCIHCGPLLLGHPIVFIRFLRAGPSYPRQLKVESWTEQWKKPYRFWGRRWGRLFDHLTGDTHIVNIRRGRVCCNVNLPQCSREARTTTSAADPAAERPPARIWARWCRQTGEEERAHEWSGLPATRRAEKKGEKRKLVYSQPPLIDRHNRGDLREKGEKTEERKRNCERAGLNAAAEGSSRSPPADSRIQWWWCEPSWWCRRDPCSCSLAGKSPCKITEHHTHTQNHSSAGWRALLYC